MDYNEYQMAAVSTDFYRQDPEAVLGLASEVGELIEKMDGNAYTIPKEYSIKDIGYELSDITWYIADIAWRWGIGLDDINKAISIEFRWVRSWEHCLIMSCGEICGLVSKLYRDSEDNQIDKEKLIINLAKCLESVKHISKGYGFTIDQIMEMNIKKLADRKRRGVLGGSGDVR